MNTLASHMNEALKIGKNISKFSKYSCRPDNKDELKSIIDDRIEKEGPNCNLNDIDTSLITDMSYLFKYSSFNGDISCWNTSKVEDMSGMFYGTPFNSDISNWDVSNVKYMGFMFNRTDFNQDISKWKLRKGGCSAIRTFMKCPIRNDYKPKALR